MPRLKLSTLDAHRKKFSDFISYRASQVGLTIIGIGEQMKISESSIQKYKHNPGTMSVDNLLKLSNALNMDASALLKIYSEGRMPWDHEREAT
jgi:transcriptional regulator with XRE-family HTH domain